MDCGVLGFLGQRWIDALHLLVLTQIKLASFYDLIVTMVQLNIFGIFRMFWMLSRIVRCATRLLLLVHTPLPIYSNLQILGRQSTQLIRYGCRSSLIHMEIR